MRIHTIGAYTLSAALLLLLFFSVRNGLQDTYSSDDSYVRDAISESIESYGVYGIDGVPKPALKDVWWRWTGGKLLTVTRSSPAAVFTVLSLLSSLALLLVLVKVLSLQYPQHRIAGWVGGLLLVLSPPLAVWCANGMSGPLASLLVLLAVIIHMSSSTDNRPLPLSSAACIGFAMTLRIELIAVWFALMTHAFLLSAMKRRRVSFAASALNGLSGLLLFSIFLAPGINWNFRLMEVPWPRSFDAALALDTLAGGNAVPATFGAIISASISGAYAQWNAGSYSGGWIVKLFACVGLLYWIARSSGGSRDNYISLSLVLLMTPVFHALLVPFVGWSGGVYLYDAMMPIWVLAVVAGIAAFQHALDPVLIKLLPAFSNHMRHVIVFGLFALTPILGGLLVNSAVINERKKTAEESIYAVSAALDQIKRSDLSSIPVLTDYPGMLYSSWSGPVYDLKGELNPELLFYMTGAPSDSLARVVTHIKEQGHERVALVVWNQAYWLGSGAGPCINVADAGMPFVCVQ